MSIGVDGDGRKLLTIGWLSGRRQPFVQIADLSRKRVCLWRGWLFSKDPILCAKIATMLLLHRLFGVFQEAVQAIARSAANASAE